MTKPSLADEEVVAAVLEKRGKKVAQYWDERENDARRYWYPLTPDGEPEQYVFSVTTALGMINKKALIQWAADQVAARAANNPEALFTRTEGEGFNYLRYAHSSVLNDAAQMGTKIHAYHEADLDWTRPFPTVDDERDVELINQWNLFRQAHNIEPLHLEVTAWSHKHNYAGTLDGIGYIDGVLTLYDLKSSRNLWPEHKEQLAALGNADELLIQVGEHEWVREAIPDFEQYAIIHLRPGDFNGKGDFVPAYWELLVFSKEEINDYFDTFLGALQVKEGRELTKKYDSK